MRRTLATFLLAVLALVGCAGCGDPPPEQGYVRDKRFEPAHWEDGYRSESYTDCGMHMNFEGEMEFGCKPATRQVYEARHHWVDDRYKLQLEDCNDEGKCRSGWRTVTQGEFDHFELGSHYPEAR